VNERAAVIKERKLYITTFALIVSHEQTNSVVLIIQMALNGRELYCYLLCICLCACVYTTNVEAMDDVRTNSQAQEDITLWY
jgi:hypothetical protein